MSLIEDQAIIIAKKRRRLFIGIPLAAALLMAVAYPMINRSFYPDPPVEPWMFRKPLPIPPLAKDLDAGANSAAFELTAQRSRTPFFRGRTTPTYGYNGGYLGPTIRVKSGQRVKVKVNNALDEITTVHWHGLEVEGAMDGGPHQIIKPGATWNAAFRVDQEAATLWYHPHPDRLTGKQVYFGLAGLLLIDDKFSEGLNLPDRYGKNDIPLIIQDRRFFEDNSLDYDTGMMFSRNGMFGDTILVNGVVYPVLKVTNGKVRFRILNGSNTRVYNLSLSDNSAFTQVASDGGFLPTAANLKTVEVSSGERAEIVVDFSKYRVGDSVILKDPRFNVIKFVVSQVKVDKTNLPARLRPISRLTAKAAKRTRVFRLASAGSNYGAKPFTINGRLFDLTRIDERVKGGDTEIWEIRNPANPGEPFVLHPIHIHGVRFQVLSRNGRAPAPNEAGWKDTILMHENETVRLIMKFPRRAGKFAYHCHMLEHEDAGMMAQYELK